MSRTHTLSGLSDFKVKGKILQTIKDTSVQQLQELIQCGKCE
jgi:hypothetical protein